MCSDSSTPTPIASALIRGSPRRVLRRLIAGDPLCIATRCEARLRERSLVLDSTRLTVRAMARAAFDAPRYHGDPPLGAWLAGCVDLAIDDLLREDREGERLELELAEPWDARYSFLAEAVGVEPKLVRRMCVIVNGLEEEVRRAFHEVVACGKPIHRFAAEGHGPPPRVEALLREACAAIARSVTPGGTGEGWRP